MDDLVGPGAEPGTVPTDLEQATGLERLEILGKMQGIDVFDMKPLDASRLGSSLLPSFSPFYLSSISSSPILIEFPSSLTLILFD